MSNGIEIYKFIATKAYDLWVSVRDPRALIVNVVKRLFLNPPKAQALIVCFVVILTLAYATRCRADEYKPELALEYGASYLRYEAPVVGLSLNFPKAGPVDTNYLVGLHLIGAASGMRNQGALTLGLVDGFGKFDIGIGLCLLHHDDERNGTKANFFLTIGYRFGGNHAARARHCSSAGMSEVNDGLDFAMHAWTIR